MKTETKVRELPDWLVVTPVKETNPVDDFFEKLSQTPREWFLDDDGALRLRARGVLQCPVSAVTGDSADYSSPYEACDRIGLKGAHVIPWTSDAKPKMYKDQKEMRTRLLEACGIEERHDD